MFEGRSKPNGTNWEKAYAIVGDGSIPECLKEECPRSCCGLKPSFKINDREWGFAAFKTRFSEAAEYEYQNRVFRPKVEDLGVHVITPPEISNPRSEFAYSVNGCMDTDGNCKLRDRKPFGCRIFPFGIDADFPVNPSCPQMIEIFNNRQIRASVMEVRSYLRILDEEKWLAKAQQIIRILQGRK